MSMSIDTTDALATILWGGAHGLRESGVSIALKRTGAHDYMRELTLRWAQSLDPADVAEVMRRLQNAQCADESTESTESSDQADQASESSESSDQAHQAEQADQTESTDHADQASESSESSDQADQASESSESSDQASDQADQADQAESSESTESGDQAESSESSDQDEQSGSDSPSEPSDNAGEGLGQDDSENDDLQSILERYSVVAEDTEDVEDVEDVEDAYEIARQMLLDDEDLREQADLLRETIACERLGWTPSDSTRALVRRIASLPLKTGSCAPQMLVTRKAGIHMNPTSIPRSEARKSRTLRNLHIADGRSVRERISASPSLKIVIDTSGSMSGHRLSSAIALGGAIYMTLHPSERETTEWYRYTTEIAQVDISRVPHLRADGEQPEVPTTTTRRS